MHPVRTQSGTPAAPHRRTVRIKQRRGVRGPTLSLLLAVIAGIAALVLWQLLQSPASVRAPQRSIESYELTWVCERGHDFRASGHQQGSDGLSKPRQCWTCGAPAYPAATYRCPVHDGYPVQYRFRASESGDVEPALVRLLGQRWVTPDKGLTCPRCARPLVYSDDPLLNEP